MLIASQQCNNLFFNFFDVSISLLSADLQKANQFEYVGAVAAKDERK